MNCFLGLEALPGALSKRRSKPACIVGGMPGGKRAAAVAAEGNVKLPAAVGDGPGPVKYGAVSKFVLRPVEEVRSELLTLTPVTPVAVCLKCSKRGSWATHALCSLNKFDSVGILSVTYHILQGIKLLCKQNLEETLVEEAANAKAKDHYPAPAIDANLKGSCAKRENDSA
uniref:Uncharacterized protein n=1 Tax=Glossina pallidipes TaxID=7398 RepID=A0A1B0A606_GLOPL